MNSLQTLLFIVSEPQNFRELITHDSPTLVLNDPRLNNGDTLPFALAFRANGGRYLRGTVPLIIANTLLACSILLIIVITLT